MAVTQDLETIVSAPLPLPWRRFAGWLLNPGPEGDDRGSSVRAARLRAELVTLTLATCTIIFAAKALLAFQDLCFWDIAPYLHDGNFFVTLGSAWLCSAEDFAVGLACLFVALLAQRLSSARWYLGTLRALAYLSTAAALVYMVVNAQIFHVVRRFLNLSLFQLAGG